MQCTDLSVGVVPEPGVPGGFSGSLGVGQGMVCFQILCQRLVLGHVLCHSPLLHVAALWPGSSRLPAHISWTIR